MVYSEQLMLISELRDHDMGREDNNRHHYENVYMAAFMCIPTLNVSRLLFILVSQ